MPRGSKPQVTQPVNLGLYYDKTPINVPSRGLQDGRNFRIRKGVTSNVDLGWLGFTDTLGLNNANTESLLHFNGDDGSTVIQESGAGSGGPPWRAWTAAGNAQLDTAVKKWETASLLLDGTGDWVTTASNSSLNLGSNNFTIHMQLRPAVDGTTMFFAGRSLAGHASADLEWVAARNANNTIFFALSNGTTTTFVTSPVTSTVLAGTFTHVAFTRSGNNLFLFMNGVLVRTGTFTGAVNAPVAALRVGAGGEETNAPWNGWIDEFHLQIGDAVWTSTFNPLSGPAQQLLSGPVLMIDSLVSRDNPEIMVVATDKDLYRFDPLESKFYWITPQYNVATVDVSGATPAVVTVDTGTPNWVTTGIKAGDLIRFGVTAEPDPDANWYVIASVDSNTQLTLTTAVTGAPLNNVAYTISRRFSGTVRDIWDTDTFVEPNDGTGDDMMFFTNGGVDSIATWTAQTPYALLRPELGFRAKQLRIFKGMMLYGNLIQGGDSRPTTFINSDVGEPLNVTTGLSSEFKVHDGVDQIHEMEDLGDNMVFYSERHVTLAQFVGDPLVFIFRQAGSGIGPLSPRLVADFGDYHEFIGADTQYRFDGVSINEVGNQVWREILRLRDASRQIIAFNHFDEENGDLIWAFPLSSDSGLGNIEAGPDEALVEHYLEFDDENIPPPYSRRNFPFLCGGFWFTSSVLTWNLIQQIWSETSLRWDSSFLSSAFPLNLVGTADGRIFIINVSQYQNGVPVSSWIRFGRRPLGDSRMRGMLRRIYPYMKQSTGNLQVITRYSDHASGEITSTQTDMMDLTLPQEGHFVVPYRRGRFFEPEFRRDDGDPWETEGFDTEIYPGGYR